MKYLILIVFFGLSQQVWGLSSNYKELQFKDYDDLNRIVQTAITKSRQFNYQTDLKNAVRPLALVYERILARPNADNLISKLVGPIEADLLTMKVYDNIITNIFQRGSDIIENSSLSVDRRATAMITMRNLLIELKPKVINSKKTAKAVCQIADWKLKIPKDIRKSTRLTSLISNQSPSDLAIDIMKWYLRQKGQVISQNKSKNCPLTHLKIT